MRQGERLPLTFTRDERRTLTVALTIERRPDHSRHVPD